MGPRIWHSRRPVLVALAVGAIAGFFLIAAVVSRRLFEVPGAKNAATLSGNATSLIPPVAEDRFRVTGIQGPVECVQKGRRYMLQAGDVLSRDDIVRTPPGSRAILRRGETEIELRESLDFRLEDLAAHTARFGVLGGDGDISASVGGDTEGLTIDAVETRTSSEGPSRFVVALNENGKVAVAVRKGRVKFRAQDTEVMVPEGNQIAADPGRPPGAYQALTEDILLLVTWPDLAPGDRTATIAGKTAPMARVTVNAENVDVAADGTFKLPMALSGKEQAVQIESKDPLGNRKMIEKTLRVPPAPASAPSLKAKGGDLWKK